MSDHTIAQRLCQGSSASNAVLPGSINWVAHLACESVNQNTACESCGLPAWAAHTWYKISTSNGRFCSILCIECALFGYGRCRWCGQELNGKADRRFCDESCSRMSRSARFGDGTRLLNYICRLFPDMSTPRSTRSRHCLQCDVSLEGKRIDSEFCSDRCRKRASRTRIRKTHNPPNIADNKPIGATTCERSEARMDLNPLPTNSSAYRGQEMHMESGGEFSAPARGKQ